MEKLQIDNNTYFWLQLFAIAIVARILFDITERLMSVFRQMINIVIIVVLLCAVTCFSQQFAPPDTYNYSDALTDAVSNSLHWCIQSVEDLLATWERTTILWARDNL